MYQTCLDGERGGNYRTCNHHIETHSTPAISNCSIRKAVPPRKNLAFPTEPFIAFADMSLDGCDQRHLQAAHGYIELGLFEEANAELEEIDPLCRHVPEILPARVAI